MEYRQILYDVADGVATITLNRPERLNAWTPVMGRELVDAFARAGDDGGVRVVVITGAGRGFCAGADMDNLRAIQGETVDAEEVDPDAPVHAGPASHAPHPSLDTAYAYPTHVRKPVIAAINGAVAGLGFTHMLYYDMRIASDRARFTTAFARRGLVAEHGSSWMLPRLVGMAHACDLMFSGRIVDADEALRMGLVNRVVAHDTLLAHVREVAAEMATLCSPRAIAVMKRMLYAHQFTDLAAATTDADGEMVASFPTDDFREGVASFLERRPPRFTGR